MPLKWWKYVDSFLRFSHRIDSIWGRHKGSLTCGTCSEFNIFHNLINTVRQIWILKKAHTDARTQFLHNNRSLSSDEIELENEKWMKKVSKDKLQKCVNFNFPFAALEFRFQWKHLVIYLSSVVDLIIMLQNDWLIFTRHFCRRVHDMKKKRNLDHEKKIKKGLKWIWFWNCDRSML